MKSKVVCECVRTPTRHVGAYWQLENRHTWVCGTCPGKGRVCQQLFLLPSPFGVCGCRALGWRHWAAGSSGWPTCLQQVGQHFCSTYECVLLCQAVPKGKPTAMLWAPALLCKTHQWAPADMGCPWDVSCFPAPAMCCSPYFPWLLRKQFDLPHSLPPPLITSLPDCVAVRLTAGGRGGVLVWLLPPLHPQLLPVVSFSFIPGSESSPSKGQHNSFKNKQKTTTKGTSGYWSDWAPHADPLLSNPALWAHWVAVGGAVSVPPPNPALILVLLDPWAPNVCVLQQESLSTTAPGLTFSSLLGRCTTAVGAAGQLGFIARGVLCPFCRQCWGCVCATGCHCRLVVPRAQGRQWVAVGTRAQQRHLHCSGLSQRRKSGFALPESCWLIDLCLKQANFGGFRWSERVKKKQEWSVGLIPVLMSFWWCRRGGRLHGMQGCSGAFSKPENRTGISVQTEMWLLKKAWNVQWGKGKAELRLWDDGG